MFLYGRNSVSQRIEVNPESIHKVFLEEGFDDRYIFNMIKERKIPHITLSKKDFLRVKRADGLQGIIAEVEKFSYAPLKELLNIPQAEQLSLIVLDSISDPQNLGAIIRTTACFGGFAIIIPKHGACEVNETVLHVASGGDNFVPISMVSNISNALIEIKKSGYWVAGAVVDGGQDLNKTKLPFPVCLLLGSEGKGIRHGLLNQIDLKLTLPMKGAQLSFNAAVACAIFCNEITRQKEIN
ncbi:MAG: 23S rRNA (guanosine(2251)-2'-O)-methyltransferase RlmB [Candidatus Omnitrophica bacterium]|nr:23S rRNA (guanosine(2251)-2'-O)-methyltransferase RlmB [Candidatus Omnitrophota bacterium]MDD5355987.1 23S rRNA (guanosine(2251)-2'-O)-methyltransferase RlmB [Candidatus Omnitrophota bacterium]